MIKNQFASSINTSGPGALRPDPITQRWICNLCWNMLHHACHHPGCCCMHHEAVAASAEAEDAEAAGPLDVDDDWDDEGED